MAKLRKSIEQRKIDLQNSEDEKDILDPSRITKRNIISEVMSRHIYVTPNVFKLLLTLDIALPAKECQTDNTYSVYTKPYHEPTKTPLSMYVSKENAIALKQLLSNKTQYMFSGRDGIRYRDGILSVHRMKLDVHLNKDRVILCNLLFGYGSKKRGMLTLTSLDHLFGQHFDDNTERYNYYRERVRSLNTIVSEKFGYDDLVEINADEVRINPIYTSKS